MPIGHFKPLELEDKAIFYRFLAMDPSQISELTFANLFMWRRHYRPVWKRWNECLLILFQPRKGAAFGLQPVGLGDKSKALHPLCLELESMSRKARVCRVGEDFVSSFVDPDQYEVRLDRDNSDYVYLAKDLATLPGRKYHKKKNHLNRFLKNIPHDYRPLDTELVECLLDMQETWCQLKQCVEKPELLAEDYAVHEALTNFDELDYRGGAIVIESKVEAFSLGEAFSTWVLTGLINDHIPESFASYYRINGIIDSFKSISARN